MFKKTVTYKLIIVIIIIFTLPVILLMLNNDTDNGFENRRMVTSEDIITAPLSEKAGLINSYVEDNAPLRETLNEEKSAISIEALNITPNDQVIVGNKGWLYLTDSVKWHTEEKELSQEELNIIAEKLTSFKEKLAKSNTRPILFIVPDKVSVYPEFLPYSIQLSDTNTDAIIEKLTEVGITALFFKDELMPYKDSYQLYARRDTHWTSIASYVTTMHLANALGSTNPPIETLEIYPKDYDGEDLARLVSIAGSLPPETDYDYAGYAMDRSIPNLYAWDNNGDSRRYHTEGASPQKVIVLTDSFFKSMEPFFTIAFEETLVKSINNYNPGELASESADLLIIELCERNLSMLTYFNF